MEQSVASFDASFDQVLKDPVALSSQAVTPAAAQGVPLAVEQPVVLPASVAATTSS